ncbi:polyketide synthase dehydratase domain-containing protein, partial [Streptomyces mobaraensis]|uniref:polyketide synthase dehydratase domain-containing protein n=1 Tax=Streptomyces mobaraensis TaxID=35621 RepID=UPI0033C1E952
MRVYSRPDDGDDAWVCHATGILTAETTNPTTELSGPWPPVGAEPVDVETFYARAAQAGYAYGPAFQGLRSVWRDGDDLLAEVALPEAAGSRDGYGIHPALLDAALHPLLAARFPDGGRDEVHVPYAWNGVSLWAVGATTVRVRLSPVEGGIEQGARVTVTDTTGGPVLSVDAMRTRAVQASQLSALQQRDVHGLFTVEWTPIPAPEQEVPDGAGWVTLDEGVTPGDVVRSGDAAPWAVVAPVDAGGDGLRTAEQVLSLVQEFLAAPRLAESRLLLVTRGAVATEDDSDSDIDPAAASVWGLVRSAQSEHPGRFVLVDTDGDDLPLAALRYAVEELGEPQLALRDGRFSVPRLTRVRRQAALVAPPGEPAWRLRMGAGGSLEDLTAVPCPEVLEPLEPGRVRVSMSAAGINFRDVLVALGMVPAYGAMGGEGAGVVTEVAPDVTHVAVGDQVMGVFEGAFGSVAVADARMVVPVPSGWGVLEAAGAPVAFLTAWYGLVELARVRPGES